MVNDQRTEELIKANALSSRALPPKEAEEEVVTEVEPEEVIEEVTEGETTEEEPTHAEKTQRGRERAEQLRKSEAERGRIATELVEAKIKLAKLEGQIEERGRQGPLVAPPEEPFDKDETLTRGELEEVLRKERDKSDAELELVIARDAAYASRYSELVYGTLENNEDKDEILALFNSNDPKDFERYGTKRSTDPVSDFEVNLANAERDILRRKNKELNEQLGGKNQKVREEEPDGAGVAGNIDSKPTPKVELIDATDKDSRAFMDFVKRDFPKTHEKMSGKYRT